ncbi:hypothetical protein C8034_v001597 [Colletotrichum sidae]|uniref:Uncharacterized protein n=1 Tax=Colletotrichum sidae TaxID=1347389 RepID=A0A4R8TEE9_9PEZI|nr:hypothetical protein C8034_v001597 [Colletotrichum sidae]
MAGGRGRRWVGRHGSEKENNLLSSVRYRSPSDEKHLDGRAKPDDTGSVVGQSRPPGSDCKLDSRCARSRRKTMGWSKLRKQATRGEAAAGNADRAVMSRLTTPIAMKRVCSNGYVEAQARNEGEELDKADDRVPTVVSRSGERLRWRRESKAKARHEQRW